MGKKSWSLLIAFKAKELQQVKILHGATLYVCHMLRSINKRTRQLWGEVMVTNNRLASSISFFYVHSYWHLPNVTDIFVGSNEVKAVGINLFQRDHFPVIILVLPPQLFYEALAARKFNPCAKV